MAEQVNNSKLSGVVELIAMKGFAGMADCSKPTIISVLIPKCNKR